MFLWPFLDALWRCLCFDYPLLCRCGSQMLARPLTCDIWVIALMLVVFNTGKRVVCQGKKACSVQFTLQRKDRVHWLNIDSCMQTVAVRTGYVCAFELPCPHCCTHYAVSTYLDYHYKYNGHARMSRSHHLLISICLCQIQELENVTMLQMSLREANKICLTSRR